MALFLSKPCSDRLRKSEKFSFRIPFLPDQGQKIPKKQQKNSKIYKTSFLQYFNPNQVEIGRERQKNNFVPNFVPTRPRLEDSKNNSKKIQKIVKHHYGNISIQTGLRQTEKEKKNFGSENRSYPTWVIKFQRKKSKKIKNIIQTLFLSKRQAKKVRKKIFSRILFLLNPSKKIPKKLAKKFKKLKNIILTLFHIQTGLIQAEKQKNKFRTQFRFYTTRARKFQKKNSKKIQRIKNIIPAIFLPKPS